MASELQSLKAGDGVIYKNVGYGLTSYERGDGEVERIENGKLFTRSFNSCGMDWDGSTGSWKFDGGLGLTTYAISADDPTGLRYIAESGDE